MVWILQLAQRLPAVPLVALVVSFAHGQTTASPQTVIDVLQQMSGQGRRNLH
jgi:hypothetical protein